MTKCTTYFFSFTIESLNRKFAFADDRACEYGNFSQAIQWTVKNLHYKRIVCLELILGWEQKQFTL